MSPVNLMRGLTRHFLLTLQLNFRSKQAIAYGYLMPVFFLLAFGSVFQSDTPPLWHQMGQLLTISILGGACFGLPTALVAERERGVWRRYRLLPVPLGGLMSGILLARSIIIALAAVLQIGLARAIYGTPWPVNPVQTGLAFLVVVCAFLGLGLLVAALADDVPAVQALGQCLFLPMIMIGGVGVPLAILPVWAQRVAGFMPGRYAVEVLQRSFSDPHGLRDAGFSLVALAVIGVAAGVAGASLFRWENVRHVGRSARVGIALALGSWMAVGVVALSSGQLKPVLPANTAWETITEAQIGQITYGNLPGDNELVTRLAPPFRTAADAARMAEFAANIHAWKPGHLESVGQSVRNLVYVATIADVSEDSHEGEIARVVFNELVASFDHDDLCRALAWVVLNPDEGAVINVVPELGLFRRPPKPVIRNRNPLFAQKYLGRLLGKIGD
jgi:ABC-2 type transport system permease protein